MRMTSTLRRRIRRTGIGAPVWLGAAAVVVAVLAGAAWYDTGRADSSERAGRDALAAATAATQAIFSYDYRTFDASVANGRQFVTGDFAREYGQTTATLKPAVEQQHAVVRAEVSAASVVSATTDRVEVLLYVNQYRRNIAISGEKVDQDRVVLTLSRVDGEWRVVQASAI
jgi:Mce-associated membrane protein